MILILAIFGLAMLLIGFIIGRVTKPHHIELSECSAPTLGEYKAHLWVRRDGTHGPARFTMSEWLDAETRAAANKTDNPFAK